MSQFNFTYRIKYLYLIQILDSRPLANAKKIRENKHNENHLYYCLLSI